MTGITLTVGYVEWYGGMTVLSDSSAFALTLRHTMQTRGVELGALIK